ncbi:hypothetical protein [Pseudooceanicola sp. LIPI14-2-Ac024]|uniref:hypothetical protein n=1 Tax=Pseudooceanicola sp. LIPI14-2-Ac024 TaxID=3344875 RepID=UPI0035CFB547
MRGIPRLPETLAARFEKTAKGDEDKASARAPKPAARSQTDSVGVAQYAIGLNRQRAATPARDRGLILPVQSEGQEDHLRQSFIGKGLFLARQDQWDVLGKLVRDTDHAREVTSEGTGAASLLALGARSDFVQAARAAIGEGDVPPEELIEALEEALEEAPECWGLNAVIALTHIEIGLAAHADAATRPDTDHPILRAHFDRAAELLAPHDARAERSVVLAEARCQLMMGAEDAGDRIGADYAALIELDPGNPAHMRRYGLRLLPDWYGSFEALDDAAHDTAERTEETWGEGGYTWVWLDALRCAPEAAERIDIDRYIEGLDDILARRGTQHIVNILAAHAGVAMAATNAPEDIPDEARCNRGHIHARFGRILRGHLRELHPRHWAEARMSPFDLTPGPAMLAEKGEGIARCLIARHFGSELAAGQVVTFSPRGLELHTPA